MIVEMLNSMMIAALAEGDLAGAAEYAAVSAWLETRLGRSGR